MSVNKTSTVGLYGVSEGMRPKSTGSRFGQQGKLSVSEMMALRERGGPNMSNVSDAQGNVLTETQAFARMPAGGYQIGGYGGGRGRGYGGYAQPHRQPIGTLGVGGGIPTSQSGRARLAMQSNPYLSPDQAWADAQKPAYQQASDDFRRDAMKPRYGTMLPTSGGSSIQGGIRGFANGTRDSGPKPQVAVVGERGPELMVVPANSAIIPGITDAATAFDEMTGGTSMEPRLDSEGNVWRYDQQQKRGIPENPYIRGNENAPSPNSFRMTPQQRYQDLSMRLDALRKEGVAQGRAAVSRLLGTQAEERDATKAFLATGKPITEAGGGGTLYKTPYGNAIVGGVRPKSFTVENFEGGRTASPSLAEASRESRADAAERTVRGLGLDRYRAMPNPTPPTVEPPSALDEIMGPPEPPPVLAAVDEVANPTGLVKPGNLDPFNRPVLQNSDGTSSTASTISIGTEQGEVLIPTVVNGVRLSEKDAISHFKKTGEHFGIFDSPKSANAFAKQLHDRMEASAKVGSTKGERDIRAIKEI